MKYALLFLALLFGTRAAAYTRVDHGKTDSVSAVGGTVSVTVEGTTIHWTATCVVQAGVVSGGVWFADTTGLGGNEGHAYVDASENETTTFTGVITNSAEGAWFQLAVRSIGPGGLFTDDIGYYQYGPQVKYKITFRIPANNTSHVIHYRFMQKDEEISSDTSLPRDPARDVLVESDFPDRITMVEFQAKYQFLEVNGVLTQIATGETSTREAGNGIPTLQGSFANTNGGTGQGPPVLPPVPVPPNAPPVAPPAPTPPPPAPDHNPLPNTPTGNGGATKEDIEKQTNDLITGMNKIIDNEHANAVTLVNGLNDLKASGTDNANAVIGAVNGVKDATGQVAKGVAETNGYLARIDSRLNSGGGSGDGTGDGTSAQAAADAAPHYSGPSVGGSMGSGAATTFTAHSAALPEITRHVGDRDIIIGRAPEWLDDAFGILRAARPLVLLALCVWFVKSCSSSMQGYVVGLSQSGTGGMSTVTGALDAVPGASLAKHLASSTAVVTVILAATAAIIALVDVAGARFGLSLSSLFNAFDLSALGAGIGWLDNYIPVGASITVVVLAAGMPYLAAPIFLLASTTARFLHL